MDHKHSDSPSPEGVEERDPSGESEEASQAAPRPSLFAKKVPLAPNLSRLSGQLPAIPNATSSAPRPDPSRADTDSLGPEELEGLALESLAEEDEPHTREELYDEDDEDDATNVTSQADVEAAIRSLPDFGAEPVQPSQPADNAQQSPYIPRFQLPTSTSAAPPSPAPSPFGASRQDNPFMRAPSPEQGPKRTLLGMQAVAPPPKPVVPLTPASAPPQQSEPGGALPAASSQFAMNFGASQAYTSGLIERPANLPPFDDATIDDFEEDDATALHVSGMHGLAERPAAPAGPSYGDAAPSPATQDFVEVPATMVSDMLVPAWGEEHTEAEEDDEDDFAAQKTEVIQSPFEQEAVTPKLCVVDGPMQGHVFLLTGLRSTVGRGSNNSATVEDLAMSRLHFEITRNPDDSYMLRDLGSANGTALNGTRVKEAILYHGDRIEAGKSVLSFDHATSAPRHTRHLIPVVGATVEGAQAPMAPHTGSAGLGFIPSQPLPPVAMPGPDDQTQMAALQIDQSTRLFTRIALIAGALCIPLCFILIVAIVKSTSSEDTPSTTTSPALTTGEAGAQAPQISAPAKAAAQSFIKGAEAIKNREWQVARAHFEAAKAVDPTLEITPQLKRIERELEAETALASARALFEQDKREELAATVATIPAESVYHAEAQKLLRSTRTDELTTTYQEALALLDKGELDAASDKVSALLQLSPEHSGGTELQKIIAQRRAELEADLKRQEADKQSAANDIFSNTSAKSNEGSSSASDKEELDKGYSLYRRKDFSAASRAFKGAGSSKGKDLARRTDEVSASWKSGSDAVKKKQWSKAISQLEKARNADRRVNKAHSGDISQDLAQAYGNAGLASLAKGDYREARKHLASGEKLKVSEQTLNRLEAGLEDEAKKIYIQAVNKKKSDPDAALQLCRKIMLMLPSSSPTYKKAQKLIFDL